MQSKKIVLAVFLATRAVVFPNWKFAIGGTIVLMVWMKNFALQGTVRGKYFYAVVINTRNLVFDKNFNFPVEYFLP